MILSAERLVAFETCPRKHVWMERYATRVSLMGALYRALDAGLKGKHPEQAASDEFLGIASNPGLDIYGHDVYAVAIHHATLAGILATALRNAFPDPWSEIPDSEVGNPTLGQHRWRSALYNAADGIPRRIVLVDKWSDDRQAAERRSWRTIAESVVLRRPITLTAIEIGSSREKRRVSPWTRCYRHPRNDVYRFRRLNSTEDFSRTWKGQWREDSGIPTAEWLVRMQKDGCMDAVHTVTIPEPARWYDFLRQMCQIAGEIERTQESTGHPPQMRLSGCHDLIHGPCPFIVACHGSTASPEACGFKSRIA